MDPLAEDVKILAQLQDFILNGRRPYGVETNATLLKMALERHDFLSGRDGHKINLQLLICILQEFAIYREDRRGVCRYRWDNLQADFYPGGAGDLLLKEWREELGKR